MSANFVKMFRVSLGENEIDVELFAIDSNGYVWVCELDEEFPRGWQLHSQLPEEKR